MNSFLYLEAHHKEGDDNQGNLQNKLSTISGIRR